MDKIINSFIVLFPLFGDDSCSMGSHRMDIVSCVCSLASVVTILYGVLMCMYCACVCALVNIIDLDVCVDTLYIHTVYTYTHYTQAHMLSTK